MLPTLANRSRNFAPAAGDARVCARPACSATPELFFDSRRASVAARVCAACPLADGCLVEAMRLHVAYVTGRDPIPVYGCWAGVWFEHGQAPRRITPARRVAGEEVVAA